MGSSVSSIEPTLRAKFDLKSQDALSHDCPKSAFISIWLQLEGDYETMRQDLNQYLSRQLDQNRIRATLYSRIKTLESIRKSIDRREISRIDRGGQKYESPGQILDDVHDLVGFRIVVDYPSGLEQTYALIEKTFRKERDPHIFSSNRQVGQYWNPRFGAYEARNYQVRLDSNCNEFSIYHDVLFEIQVTSVAESLYNKLAHPLHYKRPPGSLSRKDEMIIDMSHGLALCYWITVACMEEKLEENLEGIDQQSPLPDVVRRLAGQNGTGVDMDALVGVTPNIPEIPQDQPPGPSKKSSSLKRSASSNDTISVELLLSSLANLSLESTSEADIWKDIRSKLGLSDNKEPRISLPTVFEARFDSKDLEGSPKCHPDTRASVRSMVRSWVDNVNAETLLWLHAPAGTGKSTLARTLVDDFDREKRLAAGYFFKRGDSLRNDTCRVFSTIASQLIKTVPQYESALRKSLGGSTVEGIEKISLEGQFKTLIYNPLTCLLRVNWRPPMIIIIDALDECTCAMDIPRILKLFASFKHLDTLRLCVFFSSRRTPPLLNAFGDIPETDAGCRVVALHKQFLEATKSEIEIVLRDGLADIKKKKLIKKQVWPDPGQFAVVLNHATNPSPLFIYVSTLLRHINKRNPVQRFNNWVNQCQYGISQLDQIYIPIVTAILTGEEGDDDPEPLNDEERTQLRKFLGSLILLAKPLPARAVRRLLELDEDSVQHWLGALHAVIHVPDEESPVELIHKSFADFLLGEDETVTSTFKISPSKIHGMMAERCMSRLRKPEGLRKNLCNVSTPAVKKDEIRKQAIATSISADLEYACVYWVHHLVRSKMPVDEDMVSSFLKRHLLHWFEALSILGKLSEGGAAIRQLLNLMPPQELLDPPEGSLINLLGYAQTFIRDYGTTIQEYPLQVYSLCLALSPPEPRVKQLFAESSDTRIASIRSIKGGMVPGDTLLKEFLLDEKVICVAVSPNGQSVLVNTSTQLDVVDVGTGIVLQSLTVEYNKGAKIVAVSFLADENHAITLSDRGHVCLWDTTEWIGQSTLQCTLARPFQSDELICASIAANISLIAAMDGGSLGLWDSVTGDQYYTKRHQVLSGVCDITLTAKSQTEWTVGVIDQYGKIHLLRVCEGTEPEIFYVGCHHGCRPKGGPTVAISPCGHLLATGAQAEILLWEWNGVEGSVRQSIECSYNASGFRSIGFSPDANTLVAGGNYLTISGLRMGSSDEVIHGSLSLLGHDRIMSSTSSVCSMDTLGADINSQHPQFLNSSRVLQTVLASDRRTLMTTSDRHPLLIWDVEQGVLQHKLEYPASWYFRSAFSFEGDMFAVETLYDKQVRFWKLGNGKATPTGIRIRLEPQPPLYDMTFSPDSKMIVLVTTLRVSLWVIATGECRWYLDIRGSNAQRCEFSPDAASLAVVSSNTARMVDVSTGECRSRVCWKTWPLRGVVMNVSFSTAGDSVGVRIVHREGIRFQFLLWDVELNTIQEVDPTTQNDPQLKRAYDGVSHTENWISHGRQAVCLVQDQLNTVATAQDRVVIARNDGEFVILDFDPAKVNEI